jgi:hypothetical protein
VPEDKLNPTKPERADKQPDADGTWGYRPKEGPDEPDQPPPGRASVSPPENAASTEQHATAESAKRTLWRRRSRTKE